jgi:hypothetical protein
MPVVFGNIIFAELLSDANSLYSSTNQKQERNKVHFERKHCRPLLCFAVFPIKTVTSTDTIEAGLIKKRSSPGQIGDCRGVESIFS